jgi:hypothetical protein
MRYVLALLLAGLIGVTTVVPASPAFAAGLNVNQYGNVVAGDCHGTGGNGGGTFYVDGVAVSCG